MVSSRELNVFLDGRLAGRLHQSPGGAVTFNYDPDYLGAEQPTPLSLSMPLTRVDHPNRIVTAWLEGLLPDNLAVREEWGRRFQVSPRNAFSLLRFVGRDAAGAVQVLPIGVESSDAAPSDVRMRALSLAQLSNLLRELTVRDAGWEVGAASGRWSLAGAQNKVALYRSPDGTWGVPEGSTPTTHILKPTRADSRFEDLHVNEFVCLRAARYLGLIAAEVELADVEGVPTLIARRYDRRLRAGQWLRLHQEDLLQALALRPERKYQADGGPGLKQIAGVFSALAMPDRTHVRRTFFDQLVFNVLVGGTDAHAKNYSLLLNGSRVGLAPLYDTASYAPYLNTGESLRSAMRIGQSWRVGDVTARDWGETGRLFGQSAEESLARVAQLRDGLPAALSAAAADAPPPFRGEAKRIHHQILGAKQLRLR